MTGWLTWKGLELEPDERRACRRAGLEAADFARLGPLEIVGATAEEIREPRAMLLARRASLLQVLTPTWVATVQRLGVTDRADLAARSADDLFDTWQVASPYTSPDIYKTLAEKIAAAGGPTYPVPDDEALIRRAWSRRWSGEPVEVRTNRRLRIPAVGVNAPISLTNATSGHPVPSLNQRRVAVADEEHPDVFIGHWQWAGRYGAFLRLDAVGIGDEVELLGHQDRRLRVGMVVRGRAPLRVRHSQRQVVLMTPPHLRWRPWCLDWGDPELDPERTPVQVVVIAEPA